MSLTYDTRVSAAQKAPLDDLIGQLYPFKWTFFKTDTAPFPWNIDSKSGVATAKRDDGKAEVVLDRVRASIPTKKIVMKNLPEREIGPRPEAGFEYIANDLPEARFWTV